MAAILNDSYSFNNAGVAMSTINKNNRAISYYRKAILKSEEEGEGKNHSGTTALANYVEQLCSDGSGMEALKIASKYMAINDLHILAHDECSHRIITHYIELSFQFGKSKQALDIVDIVLSFQNLSPCLAQDICCYVALWYSGGAVHNLDLAIHYAEMAHDKAKEIETKSVEQINRVKLAVNNLSYMYAENGRLQEANQLIYSMDLSDLDIAWATKGLIYLKFGNMEKGQQLYRRAMKLSSDPELKTVMKIKMNLEICKYLLKIGQNNNRIRRILNGVTKKPLKNNKHSWRSVHIEAEVRDLLESLTKK